MYGENLKASICPDPNRKKQNVCFALVSIVLYIKFGKERVGQTLRTHA